MSSHHPPGIACADEHLPNGGRPSALRVWRNSNRSRVLVRTRLAADRRDDADAAVVGDKLAVVLGLVIDPADEKWLGRLLHERIRGRYGGLHLADHRGTCLRLGGVGLLARHEVELLTA